MDPTNAVAFAVRGESYESMGDLGAAFSDFTKVTMLNPDYLPVYVNIAQLHATMGESEEALQHYEYILAADPTVQQRASFLVIFLFCGLQFLPALGGRAELLLSMGKAKQADKAYADVVRGGRGGLLLSWDS